MSLSRRQVLGFAGASAAFAVGGGALAGAEFARRTEHSRQLPKVARSTISTSTISTRRDPNWLWRFPVAPVVGDQAVTMTVANGTLYLLFSNALCALAADSGRMLWKHTTGASHYGDLTFGAGVIYLNASYKSGAISYLAALSARTGSELWRRTTMNSTGFTDPVCDGPVVYLSISPLNNETGYIYALDALTGKLIWQMPAAGDSITLVSEDNTPTVVTETDSPIFATGDLLYTASSYKLHARNKNTGEEVWTFPYPQENNDGGPLLSGDKIYLCSDVGNNSLMVALAAETGRQVWNSSVIGGSFLIDVAGDKIFALSVQSGISALAAASGSVAWVRASSSIGPYLAVANDVALVSAPPKSLDGGVVRPGDLSGETELSALRSADGHTSWNITAAGGQLASAPVVVGDWACVAFSQQSIRVLNVHNGSTKWDLAAPVEYGPLVSGDILFIIVADEVSETGNASLSGAVCGIKI